MTFKELSIANKERADVWKPEGGPMGIEFNILELAGEVGELCNGYKKYLRHKHNMVGGKNMDEILQNIKEELADVVICANLVAIAMDINLEEAIIEKFNKTSDKYDLNVYIDPITHLTRINDK